MLAAIMIGVIIITYFIADIQRRTEIETLTIEHVGEIQDITYKTENFTDYFLQGVVKIDAAREIREIANYYFDFALFWYQTTLSTQVNTTIDQCIDNCTIAMVNYLDSNYRFSEAKPFFSTAQQYTSRDKYIEVLGYYVSFAGSGQTITMLRYNASRYLKYAAENLSIGNIENVTIFMELFNETETLYQGAVGEYTEQKGQIDEYLFFDEIREEH
jgi:hypothetical protein